MRRHHRENREPSASTESLGGPPRRGWGKGGRRRWGRLNSYVSARLHRRIFLWFGASIMLTGAVVAIIVAVTVDHRQAPWHRDMERTRAFIANRFAQVWDDPEARAEMAEELARELKRHVVLEDPSHHPIGAFGDRPPGWRHHGGRGHGRGRHWRHRGRHCPDCGWRHPVQRDSEVLGYVIQRTPGPPHPPWTIILVLLAAVATLWAASGAIARRIVRPLGELERVAREIGGGNMAARAKIGRHRGDEVGVVAEAVNDMAARIEKQMSDQRELLATVSHELRTPLGHMRVLVELARDGGADQSTMDELEQELVEADALIDELLASSRLEFDALTTRELDPVEVAERALKRADLDDDLLHSELEGVTEQLEADPTLLARALANLLRNAKTHGKGVEALHVSVNEGSIRFAVDDIGPGFEGEPSAAFQTFYHDENDTAHSSLGLGLSLVDRIAKVHGGRAGAENLDGDGRGARVWLELPIVRNSRS